MTTYSSYESAKIANPDEEIKHLDGKSFINENSGVPYERRHDWLPARPSAFCMTVEKFLADGHKFVEGDIVMSHDLVVVNVTSRMMADALSTEPRSDCNNFILRAAALEEKPKRTKESTAVETLQCLGYEWQGGELWKPPIGVVPDYLKPRLTKVEYVKVEFIKLSDAALAVDGGDIHYTNYGSQPVEGKGLARHYCNTGELSFYRRIETEIDERQEFIDTVSEILPEYDKRTMPLWIGKLYDSGKFKLVEGE